MGDTMISISKHITPLLFLPALVLVLMVTFTSISYFDDRRARNSLVETTTQLIQREALQLAALAEVLLVKDQAALDQVLVKLNEFTDLRLALVIDNQGQILHANHLSLTGKAIQNVSRVALKLYSETQQQKTIRRHRSKNTLIAAMSFRVPTHSQKAPPIKRGMVYLEYDLTPLLERSYQRSLEKNIPMLLAGLLFALLTHLLLHHYLSKPLERLGRATRRVQLGENIPLTHAKSVPEVEALTHDVNNMAQQLSNKITELNQSEATARRLSQHQQALINVLPGLLLELDKDGYCLNIHDHAENPLSIINERFIGSHLADSLPPAAVRIVMSTLQEALKNGSCTGKVIELEDPNSSAPYWFELSAARKPAQQHLQSDSVLLILRDITSHQQILQHEQSRNHVLNLLAKGKPQEDILLYIIEPMEAFDPRVICSILLLDASGRHLGNAIAPSLPAFYSEAINGLEIGYGVGSCGTAAATGKRVIVDDIMPYCGGVAMTDYFTGQLHYVASYTDENDVEHFPTLYSTLPFSYSNPSSLAYGVLPELGINTAQLLVTEKGNLLEGTSTYGNKLVSSPLSLDLEDPNIDMCQFINDQAREAVEGS